MLNLYSGVFLTDARCGFSCLLTGAHCILCVLQKKSEFPLVAIVAISVMGALILCLIIVIVWLTIRNLRKTVGKLISQPNQL